MSRLITKSLTSNEKAVFQGGSILAVDDEERYLSSIKEILGVHGYRMDTALGGRQALEKINASSYDLVLLDLIMPDVSGRQVLERIQRDGLDVAVVVVSATDSVDEATGALCNGAQDFLHKPYAPNDLLLSVGRALWARQLRRRNRQVEAQLRESEHLHRFLVDNSPDLVFTLDEKGHFVFLNERFESLLGMAVDDLRGVPFSSIVKDADHLKVQALLEKAAGEGAGVTTAELFLTCFNPGILEKIHSRYVPFELKVLGTPLGEARSEACFFGTGRDLVARKVSEARIRRLAYYDSLTDLPNRQLFADRLEYSLRRARRTGHSVALLFLDLDQFKFINDSLGHHVGDRVLSESAKRLKGIIRSEDSIARMGGDEFTVLLENIHGPSDASVVANKIVQALNVPFKVEKSELHIGVSIGVSLFPQDADAAETLLQNADVAMYRAKQKGRNNHQFYTVEMTEIMVRRMGLEGRLRKALDKEELEIYYQPQYDLRDRHVTGVEALLRWRDPDEGVLGPDRFLQLAEETGLIVPLGEWVVRNACGHARDWRDRGLEFGRLAINLSTRQLATHGIASAVDESLSRSDLPAGVLNLEITESALLDSGPKPLAVLETLREIGVSLSLDDFGTGFSSLTLLKNLPIDKLKIDRSFVQDLTRNHNDDVIVRAILALGQSLNMHVTAEGVEQEDQCSFLRRAGCVEAQGFLFSPPVPEPELQQILSVAGAAAGEELDWSLLA